MNDQDSHQHPSIAAPSPAMTAHSHDDLSWMPTLDAFLHSDDEIAVSIPRMRRSHTNTGSETTILANTPLAVPLEVPVVQQAHQQEDKQPRNSKQKSQERAARKRIREKERREQVNVAFKKLNALMMEVDSTYKPNAPFASTFSPANVGINQPYLISKTTAKISELYSENAKKEAQISDLTDEIERTKSGEINVSKQDEYEGPSVEKTEEEKRQVQMMMVPMMIPPDWMMNMMKVMADTAPGAKKRKIVEEPQHSPATSGNVAHCA
mmetsp:Transcript_24019/g.37023  ORF Transcript_24019/g.37023 Transcript_24019/m.37023 type:complete len:266 (+) Transcript_24019:117-914(+)|eukprot:CAMPEP_0196804882 /NCGR_PEP_ID=MMETSP1362-20130617/4563_1 /TAXON_ID=163516 /ORGANISM="Leptocylindrus danicus, Strain CCMP1856" /LENGTH=265 /DNA_ID=CAMNT_0042177449 /DNA_START=113 /DNA_END=910 /DNA_ORIENTATION=+